VYRILSSFRAWWRQCRSCWRGAAKLFSVVAPVLRGELEFTTVIADQRLHGIAIGHGSGAESMMRLPKAEIGGRTGVDIGSIRGTADLITFIRWRAGPRSLIYINGPRCSEVLPLNINSGAQKLMLECDEERFLRLANRHRAA
jgi:hypothetical protein